MKIGIPQSLLYSYYYPFWKTYFEELGLEVVTTPATTKTIIDKGVKASVPEICVPIKVYIGHVLTLLEKEVDYIFIPRFVAIKKDQFFCPKFMGLPDMIRHSIHGIEEKMIMPFINTKSDNIAEAFKHNIFGEKLLVGYKQNKNALEKAEKVWLKFRESSKKGYSIMEACDIALGKAVEDEIQPITEGDSKVTIGLLGYVYNIYDPFISMDILTKLREMGVGVKTFEMLKDEDIHHQLKTMSKTLFWTFSDKLMAAGYHFYKDTDVDGLIHVTAFGCGPDSLLGKLMELDSPIYKKPFMTVRVDEHSGENHLQTRIEAFVDMIKRKKSKVQRGA
ncbi:acyl-CoA dehydratase activase-related protein [Natronincola ferrireducens]|uniref:Predicted nucleotide-binding protein, sugar kinase/HSP70/actin superfamily n=1 Tax=Natronincola ferrireducens TaxID=393762 RepID=A0A1G8ZIV2_9FIRM|nr:acyl-CoA dehydratase activase-related protein [Natronincola ferrireducens]SDK14524.1 Predicted nucleotide-binding protein, sugar kinase/HSP70/actin superfamily [Natronincola ferrireducens]